MKNKKKLIKRIGALLCAVVVAVSILGVSTPFYAGVGNKDDVLSLLLEKPDMYVLNDVPFEQYLDSECLALYPYYCVYVDSDNTITFLYSSKPSIFDVEYFGYGNLVLYAKGKGVKLSSNDGLTFSKYNFFSDYGTNLAFSIYSGTNYKSYARIIGANHDIYYNDFLLFSANNVKQPIYNPSLGYLQNVRVENQYLRGEVSIGGVDLPLYYDDALDTLKRVWKFDTVSSSGVDLSSGYSVRHYIKMATVEGYDKEDIIEMSDMYLMGEYDASVGRLEYMEKDYDEKLVQLGYEELGFFDTVFKGLFTLQHHYFQIVNTSTNEMGGYLHVFPQNKDGNLSFEVFGNEGVELGFEGLDENLNVDIEAPSGEVGESVGHGDTYEEAEQQAQETQLRIEGMEQFVLSVESYASQVGNVSKGVGAFLGSLPPWVLGLFGLGVAITFVVIVIKGIRG